MSGRRPGPAPGLQYAGFWIRLVASLVDIIPIAALGTVTRLVGVTSACTTAGSVTSCSYQVNGVGLLSVGAILALYWIVSWSLLGASLGQKLCGLHVVNAANGQTIGIGRAVLRYVGFVLSTIPCDIGLIWAAFDSQKQGWHDKIAGTFVVRRG